MKETSFKAWYNDLNSLCILLLDLEHDELPDLTMIHDLWAEGYTPKEAFEVCCDAWAEDDQNFAEMYYLS
jgi:hypothetical protein